MQLKIRLILYLIAQDIQISWISDLRSIGTPETERDQRLNTVNCHVAIHLYTIAFPLCLQPRAALPSKNTF